MNKAPRYTFYTLWLGGIAIIPLTFGSLPERVATHFGANGMPDEWMPRSTHTVLTFALVAIVPALIAGVFSAIKYLPPAFINIPNKNYWLAPERRAKSLAWLRDAGLWFASLEAAFFIGLHFLVLRANAAWPPRMSNAIWLMLAIMVGSIAYLIAAILRRFPRQAPSEA